MSFVNGKFIASGVYTISNAHHNGSSVTCHDDKQLFSSSTDEYKWTVTNLSNKKWIIESCSRDISPYLPADAKEGREVPVQPRSAAAHTWVIKQRAGEKDCYTVSSTLNAKLFWNLPSPGAPLKVSSARERKCWWKFQKVVEVEPNVTKEDPTVNLGYDKPHPTSLADYFKQYDVIVVVDDSGSMVGERWSEMRSALAGIADEAGQNGAGGFSVCFFNSPINERNIASKDALLSVFSRLYPRYRTPAGARLRALLDEAINKLDCSVGTPSYSQIKPLDIIVLTDCVPTDKPEAVIEAAAKRLDEGKHHHKTVGIQFLQIGDEEGAELALKTACKGLTRNMVKTVPYDVSFTAEKLTKILLAKT